MKGLTEQDVKFLGLLMEGKYLKGSVTVQKRDEMKTQGVAQPWHHMKKLVEMGVILGFVPILSEDGQKALDAANEPEPVKEPE